ncbi:hypothetical protein [Saccharibacillus deserti]|uniref:hypothetical protein n=1 Tax=Saccharibacillus deserti TaxID=1634444 RepID=UPI0015524C14|nr:hypothetical protein [Saccharibacillus deserti]
MNLFRMSPFVGERSRLDDFLRDCFVSIGYPGIGSLENAEAAEVSKRLNRVYGYEGNVLKSRLGSVEAFVRDMNDGDYVLLPCGGRTWLGDLGDYYYRDDYDSKEEATCHRRGVTWLGVLPTAALSPALREFLRAAESGQVEDGTVARFALPAEQAGLEAFAAQAPGGMLPGFKPEALPAPERESEVQQAEACGSAAALVGEETLKEAVAVLREALHGGDPLLRVRAAEALLRYAK